MFLSISLCEEKAGRFYDDLCTDFRPFQIGRIFLCSYSDLFSIHYEIAVFHFNDAPAFPPREQQHDKDRVMPGDGHLDLKRLLNHLRSIGYNRWLSLELFREDLWADDPRDVARVGLEKMQQVAEM